MLTVLTPRSYAAFNNGRAFSSSRTQSAHFRLPIDMHPTIGTETCRPEFPRRLYSALEFSRETLTLGGSGGAIAMRFDAIYERITNVR